MVDSFKCPLCHFDYTDKIFITNDLSLYFNHLRDIHKTTDFNLDRFKNIGYQYKTLRLFMQLSDKEWNEFKKMVSAR